MKICFQVKSVAHLMIQPTYRILNSNLSVQVNPVNLCQKLSFFAQHGENVLCTKMVLNVRNNICTQYVLPGPGLSLEFSCIEFVIQWTICRAVVSGSVNPIQTRGGRLCPPHYYLHPRIRKRNDSSDLSSYCGLVDATIRASDKDLPVV